MKSNTYIIIILFKIVLIANPLLAQNNTTNTPNDDLGNVEDQYQTYFFEALKQKGIENYERAITALQKCLSIDNTKPVIYFELGKNYNQLKNYIEAEKALQKAIAMQPDNVWFLDELYETYYQQNNTTKVITILQQLINHHPDYKEDLASIYTATGNYTKALQLLDELDSQLGPSPLRTNMRNTIYNASGNANERITYLEQQVKNNPQNEDNQLKLIYRYSESGQKEKAYKTALNLLKNIPNSELVHLALYKFYLDNNNPQNAILSIKKVMASTIIDAQSKATVLKNFTAFVSKNPKYETDLLTITNASSTNNNPLTLSNLGQYYNKTGDKSKALLNYKAALKENPNDFKLIKTVLQLELENKAYKTVITDSKNALTLYPAQPILYLINAIAQNKLGNYGDAIENLELGLEFLVENPKMEANFYNELSNAYKGLNNINKAQAFANKAKSLKTQH